MSETARSAWPTALLDTARRRAGGLVLRYLFEGLSRVWRLHPHSDPARHGVEVLADIPYRDGGSAYHLLDVYRPLRETGPRPVVLYAHGGAFRILSKNTHWGMALAFARRGYLVFNINYRLAPEHRFPAACEDVAAAYAWVVKNAAGYGGDPRRIALAGESAGGNLITAATVAMCYRRPEPWAQALFALDHRPRAVAPACAVLQVSDPERHERRRNLPRWVQDRLSETSLGYLPRDATPQALEMADPVVVLEGAGPPERPLPPFFVPCGTRDPLLDDTRRLHAALLRLGATSELAVYPGGVHAFHAFVWQELARRCWRDQFDFLARHL